MAFVNQHNIPLSLAVWLAHDDYDYNPDPFTISATTLLKPVKQIILASRVLVAQQLEDISNRIASKMGSSIHEGIEYAWKDNPQKSLTSLGYPKKVIDAVVVNPDPSEDLADKIPVYMEQRIEKKLGKWTITGKFDFLAEGELEDFKSTSVYAYMHSDKDEDYTMQGSIYRWIDPNLITSDYMSIRFIFTDWQKAQTYSDPNYPKLKIASKRFQLKSKSQTRDFIKDKVIHLEKLWNEPENKLPRCTDKELWRSPTVWKYYGKADAKRASKVFDNPMEANRWRADKGKGEVREVKGEVKACKWCPAITECKQKDEYLASGLLVL